MTSLIKRKSRAPEPNEGVEVVEKTFFFNGGMYNDEEYSDISKEAILVSESYTGFDKRVERLFTELEDLFKVGEIGTIKYLSEKEKHLDLQLVTYDGTRLVLRIKYDDLYLIGFKTTALGWYEFRTPDEPKRIKDAKDTGYSANYSELGGDGISTININTFYNAVEFINHKHEPSEWRRSTAVIAKSICESLRFKRVRAHFLDESRNFEGRWDDLEQLWGKISKTVWAYKDNNDININLRISNYLVLRSFADLEREVTLIKNRHKKERR